MTFSQKNYKKVLPKELIKQAEKCQVRECDETRKGFFEAYVDEKEKTFDVTIAISKEEVTEQVQRVCQPLRPYRPMVSGTNIHYNCTKANNLVYGFM